MREEEADPLVEEDVQVGHQAHQEDHQVGRQEEIMITEIGTILRETMKATT